MTREINAGSKAGDARQRWRTNRRLAAWIAERFEIDLDAMALPRNAIVPRFIGAPLHGLVADHRYGDTNCVGVDALTLRWSQFGSAIFVNPEFALLARVVHKAIEASQDAALVVMLAPDNSDTRWFGAIADAGAEVYRFAGRPRYEPDDDLPASEDSKAPGFPSALYVLRPFIEPRRQGAMVPTFRIDHKTFETL